MNVSVTDIGAGPPISPPNIGKTRISIIPHLFDIHLRNIFDSVFSYSLEAYGTGDRH
jgi:hypothetical protein